MKKQEVEKTLTQLLTSWLMVGLTTCAVLLAVLGLNILLVKWIIGMF